MIEMFPTDDKIVGINCFDELLVKNELIDCLNKNFPQDMEQLLFFSKKLKLYVYKNIDCECFLKYFDKEDKL